MGHDRVAGRRDVARGRGGLDLGGAHGREEEDDDNDGGKPPREIDVNLFTYEFQGASVVGCCDEKSIISVGRVEHDVAKKSLAHDDIDAALGYIHAFDVTARSLDDYRRLADLGVTDICVNPWNPYDPSLDRESKLAHIENFAQAIISRF